MKRFTIVILAISMALFSNSAFAETANKNAEEPAKASVPQTKFYGFIRTYSAFDTRESVAGTQDLFYYLPKDKSLNSEGTDLNELNAFRFFAITTRMGVNIGGYQYGSAKIGGKIEADFYCMNGAVATLRLRQAYTSIEWDKLGKNGNASFLLNVGQTWHPLACDLANVVDLEVGTPFTAFNRSPQIMGNYSFNKNFTLTGGVIYQMQYQSTGPSGKSSNYMKYACTPEAYLGVALKTNDGLTAKAGVDILSIKPRWTGNNPAGTTTVKMDDRITTATPFLLAQYTHNDFQVMAKTYYASAGEHINFLTGYGVSKVNSDGSYEYTPMRSSISMISAQYGTKWQVMGMLGYIKLLGTAKELHSDKNSINDENEKLTSSDYYYFNSNGFSNMNSMMRFTPTIVRNFGKLSFAIEYDLTGVQYGDYKKPKDVSPTPKVCVSSKDGLVKDNLHWVFNNRILGMLKFTF
jgi:hypothetical protein